MYLYGCSHIKKNKKKVVMVENASQTPELDQIESFYEPMVEATLIYPI